MTKSATKREPTAFDAADSPAVSALIRVMERADRLYTEAVAEAGRRLKSDREAAREVYLETVRRAHGGTVPDAYARVLWSWF